MGALEHDARRATSLGGAGGVQVLCLLLFLSPAVFFFSFFPLADLSGWMSLCLQSDERPMECCLARPEWMPCVQKVTVNGPRLLSNAGSSADHPLRIASHLGGRKKKQKHLTHGTLICQQIKKKFDLLAVTPDYRD